MFTDRERYIKIQQCKKNIIYVHARSQSVRRELNLNIVLSYTSLKYIHIYSYQ